MKTGLEIAQEATLRPIGEVAESAGLEPSEVEPYGRHKAKVDLSVLDRLADRPDGRLIIVTAITPTKAGEGKTTTAIGLTQGLGHTGRSVMLCMREPSVGPVFGVKGGGTGGGYAQVLPMEDINLHLNGDFHAVTAAHNLLAAALDASIYNDNPLEIEARSITWPRTLDVNDRALRDIIIGLGGTAHGVPRESGFVITAASEIMALLGLSTGLADLRRRLGRIVVAETRRKQPVTAEDIKAAGAMTVLMKDAIRPNLVQTIEGQPTLIHTGPFGNIATGNNSILADRVGLKLADYVVTEAGFGSDLGFEKFAHIVCRYGNLRPSAAVLVATVRALKSHGGVADADLGTRDDAALARGAENLAAHIDIVRTFRLPVVVSINRFHTDTDAEVELLASLARDAGAQQVVVNEGFEKGGAGSVELANAVVEAAEPPSEFAPLNPPGLQIKAQIERIATTLYGADGVDYTREADQRLSRLDDLGLGELPVCMAKTHMSLSHDPSQRGRPKGFRLPIRNVYASVGAGFAVALCGDIMLMPGLGRAPAFVNVDVDVEGRTIGLF
ncbi:MAG TPA: formate--tetrahydrofolate ligase [Actinomycetota bacterium]